MTDYHLIDLGFAARELRKLGEPEMTYLRQVIEGETLSNYVSEHSMTRRFEEAFAKRVGARKAMAKNSAMSGLCEAVSVSGAGPGYEVICDPVVHFGGLAAIYFNAVPRFADIKRDTYNMNPESLVENITPLTRAVIVTHLWGQPAEIDTYDCTDMPRQGHIPDRGLRPLDWCDLERAARRHVW